MSAPLAPPLSGAARAALALALAACACAGPGPRELAEASDGRYAMGTVLEITLYGPDPQVTRPALDALFALAVRLEERLTRFDPASELSRLNGTAGLGPQPVSPEFAAILAQSLEYADLTGGAFDVTVGPLVQLWNDAAARGAPPTAAELARARRRVGTRHVRLDPQGRVELTGDDVALDLGGIAKGYALDRMLPLLRERGIASGLLNFGRSSTWAIGAPPGASGWRLLARGAGSEPLGVITLRDRALSVSGSLGQWVEIGGRRYGHVLDPRSGRPLTRRRQALVVAPSAALAEALSTALVVLDEGEGIALVDAQPGCEGLLVDAEGGRWATPGWQDAVDFQPVRAGIREPEASAPAPQAAVLKPLPAVSDP